MSAIQVLHILIQTGFTSVNLILSRQRAACTVLQQSVTVSPQASPLALCVVQVSSGFCVLLLFLLLLLSRLVYGCCPCCSNGVVWAVLPRSALCRSTQYFHCHCRRSNNAALIQQPQAARCGCCCTHNCADTYTYISSRLTNTFTSRFA